MDEATLKRLLAVKARLDAHPEVADQLLARVAPSETADPVKDFLEPLEQALADAEKKKSATPAPPDAAGGTPTKEEKDAAGTAVGPSAEERAAATSVVFWDAFDAKGQVVARNQKFGEEEEKAKSATPKGAVHVTLRRGAKTYEFWLHGTLVRPLDKFDRCNPTSLGEPSKGERSKNAWEWLGRIRGIACGSLFSTSQARERRSDGGVDISVSFPSSLHRFHCFPGIA